MAHGTAHRPTAAEHDQHPLDVEVMRGCTRRLLAEDAQLPDVEELETLTLQLRGHIALLIPEVEQTAAGMPEDDIPRYCALACVGEARGKLSVRPKPGHAHGLAHARRLARVVNALCDHHENLIG